MLIFFEKNFKERFKVRLGVVFVGVKLNVLVIVEVILDGVFVFGIMF